MSADRKNTSSKNRRYPEDRGVGGLLSGYGSNARSAEQTTEQATDETHRSTATPAANENSQEETSTREASTDEKQVNKARVLYHLPKTHIAALDEIKAELKGRKGYSARDASYSAIVAQAIERYYTDLFPDREPPG